MSPPTARFVAVHGLPTSPALWAGVATRVPMLTPALGGVGTVAPRASWTLDDFVADLLPFLDGDTVLIGHDLGGVVAAMAATRVPLRALVLSGTALGPYWAPVRFTARAPLHRYFYEHHAGRKFLTGAVSPPLRSEVVAAFPPVPELPARMRAIAQAMTPPADLAKNLRLPVHLLWGRNDRWYPPVVARAVARGTDASLTWVPGGHLCMWEFPDAYALALRALFLR